MVAKLSQEVDSGVRSVRHLCGRGPLRRERRPVGGQPWFVDGLPGTDQSSEVGLAATQGRVQNMPRWRSHGIERSGFPGWAPVQDALGDKRQLVIEDCEVVALGL